MIEIIKETLIDSLKLLPFLFVAFLIIEFLEHKLVNKNKKMITKTKKFGPIIGSILGLFPQCGFSVLATNLYVTRIVTLGTLVSIYLATSDEMLLILISEHVDISLIIKILFIKMLIGMICGIFIDLVYKKTKKQDYNICEEEKCHCEKGIFYSAIKHTLNILLFIIIISFAINIIFTYFGEEYLSRLLLKDSLFSPFLTSLIGLIPNCCSSVILTELYLNGAISFASMMSGLLTGSGVAILVLFKANKNLKENMIILGIVYFAGVLSGILMQIIGLM